MDCIFCKIINGELPSSKVFENDKVTAFLDINPVNPGHVLVVPKKHVENLSEVDEENLKEVILAIQKVANGITKALGVNGFNVMQNHGVVAGQIVPHLHWHIMPRKEDDGLRPWAPRLQYKEGEKEQIAKKIRENIIR
jgi:histidine triad (HIT) family protein